jgi:hypothetical protein
MTKTYSTVVDGVTIWIVVRTLLPEGPESKPVEAEGYYATVIGDMPKWHEPDTVKADYGNGLFTNVNEACAKAREVAQRRIEQLTANRPLD